MHRQRAGRVFALAPSGAIILGLKKALSIWFMPGESPGALFVLEAPTSLFMVVDPAARRA